MYSPIVSDRSQETSRGLLLIVVTLLGWSSVTLFLKYFTAYIDGWTANGWRYGISAIFWAPLLVVRLLGGRLPPGIWRAAIVPSLFNLAAQVCFAWAPYYIDPGFITFLLRLQIVFVALGAYLFFPTERAVVRSWGYALGVLLVLAGLVGLCFLGVTRPRGATAVGISLALGSGILYAGYALGVRHFMHEVRSTTAFAVISLYTAAGVLLMMLLFAEDHGANAWRLSWGRLALLFASAMAGIAITHVTYYAAIARLGVAVSAGVIMLQPFLTSAASFYLFDERLTHRQWLSGIVALAGAITMLRAQRRPAVAADGGPKLRGAAGTHDAPPTTGAPTPSLRAS
jgi:drug/metabolite transporter (DMT)-like permease